jgi:hypothetical protein
MQILAPDISASDGVDFPVESHRRNAAAVPRDREGTGDRGSNTPTKPSHIDNHQTQTKLVTRPTTGAERTAIVLRLSLLVVLASFLLPGCEASAPEAAIQPVRAVMTRDAATFHPIELRNPPSLGELDTGLHDVAGSPVGVSCVTCHAPGSEEALASQAGVPKDFHAGIELAHGSLLYPVSRTRTFRGSKLRDTFRGL